MAGIQSPKAVRDFRGCLKTHFLVAADVSRRILGGQNNPKCAD
jgi:hypothetical protein